MKDIQGTEAELESTPFDVVHDYRTICKVRRRKVLRKLNKLNKAKNHGISKSNSDFLHSSEHFGKATFNEESLWDVLFDGRADFKTEGS